jgi:hypothetical protein
MKTIIAGSRTITDFALVANAIKASGFKITEVVSGGCSGPDQLGERWAALNNVPVKVFPADWEAYGKAAGPMRNERMAAYADALIACFDGKSRGTANMIEHARERGLRIHCQGVI